MRLSDWIRANMDVIMQAWEGHARTIFTSETVTLRELHDHAREMLRRIADEMDQPQSEPDRWSEVRDQARHIAEKTSAHRHGSERMRSGLYAVQMTNEFRALRSNVIHLWTQSRKTADHHDFKDLIQFDQAVDRAMAESVESFTRDKEKQERLFQTMLSSSPDPSYILDTEGRVLHANKAATALYSTTLRKIIGNRLADLALSVSEDLRNQFARVVKDGAQQRCEIMMRDARDKQRCLEYIHTPVINAQGQIEAVVASARDITQRLESEAQLWQHANYDLLTGLPNRRLFRDRLDQQSKHSERSGAPFAVFFIDLDRFKEVNDLLGHDSGDLLLKQAAERIRGCVRETDTVARLGGDEFTVILLDTDNLVQIEEIARDILAELGKPFHLGTEMARISGSVGITRYPDDGHSSRQLLKNADQAMYAAKKGGRNRFCVFAKTMEEAATGRARMAHELRQALADDQLELHYQPIFDLENDQITKAEALMRWNHPTRGLLPPVNFLELAEDVGLIGDIETWAFTEAATHSKRWNDLTGCPFQVSLNMSAMHFSQPIPRIDWSDRLAEIGLPGAGMTLEFTEKLFLHAEDSLVEELSKLEKAGITLALDDFGTGRSSMACLQKFNIRYLKIDPSFVNDNEIGNSSRMIAETIIVMAHQLGLKVIAEGVETLEQKKWLQRSFCDYAQGFFFSRPLPAEEFGRLLEARVLNTEIG